ncbi:MAG TPA: glycosyltransferase [Solirubrobacteraceae bacterium]|nr:glycosyltransferase [Solirubrobacteraceae bacterium]
MSDATAPVDVMGGATAPVEVEIVIPVHNERTAVEGSVRRLHGFLTRSCPFSWRILIADGASTDGTLKVSRRLTYELDHVEAIRLAVDGRDLTLRAAARQTNARAVCFMDLDHANSDLTSLPAVVAARVSNPTSHPLTFLSPRDRKLAS